MKIILASNSPRRKELLNQIKVEFEVIASNIDEKIDIQDFNSIEKAIEYLAYIKAEDIYKKTNDNRIIIGADTVVCLDNKILGKPKNKNKAFEMLNKLQRNKCEVITGMCVISEKDNIKTVYKTSNKCIVNIQKMSVKEINEYIQTGEPLDKAGAFAIQGIGARYIESIQGDYYSVVGLPINKLYNILKENNDME